MRIAAGKLVVEKEEAGADLVCAGFGKGREPVKEKRRGEDSQRGHRRGIAVRPGFIVKTIKSRKRNAQRAQRKKCHTNARTRRPTWDGVPATTTTTTTTMTQPRSHPQIARPDSHVGIQAAPIGSWLFRTCEHVKTAPSPPVIGSPPLVRPATLYHPRPTPYTAVDLVRTDLLLQAVLESPGSP